MGGPISILIVLVFFAALGAIIYVAVQKSGDYNKKQAAREAVRRSEKAAKQADRQAKRIERIRTSASQMELYDIALNAKDRAEAEAAIETLTDKRLLRKAALQASHRDKVGPRSYIAEKAVERLDDQDMLYEVATTATDSAVQIWAIRKLESQEQLESIVFWEGHINGIADNNVRLAAVERLTNQDTLRRIAFDRDFDYKLRIAAMKRFTDMADIERFAREELGHEGRVAALERIEDEELRRDIEASWSPEQIQFDRNHAEWEREKAQRIQEQRAGEERRRKWASEGRCPHCGVLLTTPRGGIPDGAAAYCSNCNKRVR